MPVTKTKKNPKLDASIKKSKIAETKLKKENLKKTLPAKKAIPPKPIEKNILSKADLLRKIEKRSTDIFTVSVNIPILIHDSNVDRIEKSLSDYTEFEQSTSYAEFEAITLTPDLKTLKGNRTLDYMKKKSKAKKDNENYQYIKIRIEYNSTSQQIQALYTNNSKSDNLKSFIQLCLQFPSITISGKADKYLYIIGLWIYSLNSLFTIDLKDVKDKLSFKQFWNNASEKTRLNIFALIPPISFNMLKNKLSLKVKKGSLSEIDAIRNKGLKGKNKDKPTTDWQQKLIDALTETPSESVLSQYINRALKALETPEQKTEKPKAKKGESKKSVDLINDIDEDKAEEEKTEKLLKEKPRTTKKSNIVINDNITMLKTAIKKESKKENKSTLSLISNALYTLLLIGYDAGCTNTVLTDKADFANELQNLCRSNTAKVILNDEDIREKILSYTESDDVINAFFSKFNLKLNDSMGLLKIMNDFDTEEFSDDE